MTLPLTEQISCVKRELALRGRVYPGMVERGRQTQAWADYQIAAMTAVLATLQGLEGAQRGDGQAQLFASEKEDA